MTIKKYYSFEEARQDQWVFHPDADYYKRLRNFYRFTHRFAKLRSERGIRKFRDIKDKQMSET